MWVSEHWYYEPAMRAMVLTRAGDYDLGSMSEIEMRIDIRLIPSLVEEAMKEGLLPVKITPQSREEDLKIIHRLMDIMDREG